MKRIRGRKALVTGAASGIGRAIALALAKEGADLYLVDINEAGLAVVAEEARRLGVEAIADVRDLAQPGQAAAVADAAVAHWGGVEILVNCAGIAYRGPTDQMSDEAFDRLVTLNLLAPMRLTRRLLPTLLAQPAAHVVNVCSLMGLIGSRKAAAYQTSKFGLVGFSQALRAEYDGAGIGVTALCPNLVRTPMLTALDLRKAESRAVAWLGADPERIAAKALTAIRKNKGIVVVAPLARLFWLLGRLAPGLVDWLNRRGWRRRPDRG